MTDVMHKTERALPFALKLLRDCEAMAKYTTDYGLPLPEKAAAPLIAISAKVSALQKQCVDRDQQPGETDQSTLNEQASQALAGDVGALVALYNQLLDVVKPATPQSILATELCETVSGRIKNIPLINMVMNFGIAALILFMVTKFCLLFTFTNQVWSKVLFQVDLVFAAALGSAFYALYTANRYVVARTFDFRYETYYKTRAILGIIAGVILANLITPKALSMPGQSASFLINLTPSLIALLGGYSADAVNRILKRLVDMLVTLVRGEAQDIVKAKEAEWDSKLKNMAAQQKMDFAQELQQFKQHLDAKSADKITPQIDRLLDKLLG